MSSLSAEDLIYYNDKDNNIYSGGYKVNSIMMKNGLSPMVSLSPKVSLSPIDNLNQLGGEKINQVSDLFQNLAVPNWALYLPPNKSPFFFNENKKKGDEDKAQLEDQDQEDYILEEDLHDKLLALISPKEKELMKSKIKFLTKKNKNTLNPILKRKNKTKKNFQNKNKK